TAPALFVRPIKPGTGNWSAFPVGRLILWEFMLPLARTKNKHRLVLPTVTAVWILLDRPVLNGRPVASMTQTIQVENRASPSRVSVASLGVSPFFQRAALCLVR